ncbi:ArsA family ATPase [Pseudidiomarina sp. YC-516-91]|uniref:ArsA family ATPase n=1 Tax=Pseudidiomarina salilacus TaxID=3384452 RepID=UPI0039855512
MQDSWLNQMPPIIFLGGKGGVGKTSVSSALALLLGQQGKRVLLVSTDPAHSLADAFGRPIGAHPTAINAQVDALELDPDAQVEAHIDEVLRAMKDFAKPTMYPQIERQLKLSAQSPGTQEAALLESMAKWIDSAQQQGYDHLIFDTAPTGHTLRLLILPEAMAAWTQGLLQASEKSAQLQGMVDHLSASRQRSPNHPLAEPQQHGTSQLGDRQAKIAARLRERQQLFQRARERIKDPQQTAIAFVLTPEKLPMLETERAVQQLREAKLPIAALFINRNLPGNADGEFLAQRRQQEQVYREQINQLFDDLPKCFLPLFATDLQELAGLEAFAQVIATSQWC